jgi:hypothetical protein
MAAEPNVIPWLRLHGVPVEPDEAGSPEDSLALSPEGVELFAMLGRHGLTLGLTAAQYLAQWRQLERRLDCVFRGVSSGSPMVMSHIHSSMPLKRGLGWLAIVQR